MLQTLIIAGFAFTLCSALIFVALPYASRLSVALPIKRSSHDRPIPQSGGLFVMFAFAVALWAAGALDGSLLDRSAVGSLLAAAIVLCLVGHIDDRHGLAVATRLLVFSVVSAAYVAAISINDVESNLVGSICDVVLLCAAINLTNFMDGIDGMIVVGVTPLLAFVAILASMGGLAPTFGLVAAALLGSLLGFFLFNKPKARIFLGDCGSLPIGFLCGALMLHIARTYGYAPALILPLYFLADTSLTLAGRLWRRQPFWRAHREHFYQMAFDAGQSNWLIIGQVAAINILLCIAGAFALTQEGVTTTISLGFAVGAVLLLMRRLKSTALPP